MKLEIKLDLPNLGKDLRTLRTAKGWSLNATAQKIALQGGQLTAQSIQKIETGQIKAVPFETLQMLCSVLNLDLQVRLENALKTQFPIATRAE